MIYLDNAATTFPKPEALYDAVDYAQKNIAFNAGRGSYKEAVYAFNIIEETRQFLCEKTNAKSLIFTPSATHSLNYIISGLDFNKNDIVYFSPYDHNAIVRTLYAYSKKIGFTLKQLPLDKANKIDLEQLQFDCIKYKPKAIFCTHVSNVIGYILPIPEIGKLARQNNILFVVDGAQALGLIDVDLKKSFIDYYVFAGHKTLYGPMGIGGYLIGENAIDLNLSLFGGTGTDSLNNEMPNEGTIRYEPSSPNVVGIYGLLKSSEWVFSNDLYKHEQNLLKYAFEKMKDIDDIIIYSVDDFSKNTGIISFNINGFKSGEVASILSDDYDICVRSGYHCCPYIHDIFDTKKHLGTVRISFSYFNTISDINFLINAIEEIALE